MRVIRTSLSVAFLIASLLPTNVLRAQEDSCAEFVATLTPEQRGVDLPLLLRQVDELLRQYQRLIQQGMMRPQAQEDLLAWRQQVNLRMELREVCLASGTWFEGSWFENPPPPLQLHAPSEAAIPTPPLQLHAPSETAIPTIDPTGILDRIFDRGPLEFLPGDEAAIPTIYENGFIDPNGVVQFLRGDEAAIPTIDEWPPVEWLELQLE